MVAAHFLGRTAAFVLGEETVLLVPDKGDEIRAPAHGGGILSAAGDGERMVTGGDDGKVVATAANGETKSSQPTRSAAGSTMLRAVPDGAVAWSAGKSAFVRTAKGDTKSLEVASTVGGLAFAPKGLRLAVAHYNGVSLWFPNAQAAPEKLEWKGSHHDVAFSADGRFLVTAMQEPALHGWRTADAKHMRMTGYSARVRSFGWTASGKWLATSGSEQLVLWPFQSKDGPMGKQPQMYAAFAVRARGGLPSEAGGGGGRLCRRHGAAGAARRRRRGAGEEAGRGAGLGAGLGFDRHAARLGCRGRRGGRDRARLNKNPGPKPGVLPSDRQLGQITYCRSGG